jgi:hypothetical protein
MHWIIKYARFLLLLAPAVGLVMPAFAQARDPLLSDSQEAGSVIVFPKFIKGTVNPDGVATPQTEIEVGVVCPNGVTCPEHQPIKIRFHWVCGTNEAAIAASFVCKETDFDVTTSVFGKVVFNANGTSIPGSNPVQPGTPPAAECDRGYLIGWVINPANDQPIKFDGLVGDAVLRTSDNAVSEYGAIPIQADPNLANGAAITTVADALTGTQSLRFDGADGHYQAVTGAIRADVRFDHVTGNAPYNRTSLTLLTLDTRSNLPNYPTFVALDFYNETERLTSTATEFICWEEVQLSDLDANLTREAQGVRKGLVVSGQAFKTPFNGIFDNQGPVTLLGLVETTEGPGTPALARLYVSPMYNNSVPIPTTFVPY